MMSKKNSSLLWLMVATMTVSTLQVASDAPAGERDDPTETTIESLVSNIRFCHDLLGPGSASPRYDDWTDCVYEAVLEFAREQNADPAVIERILGLMSPDPCVTPGAQNKFQECWCEYGRNVAFCEALQDPELREECLREARQRRQHCIADAE